VLATYCGYAALSCVATSVLRIRLLHVVAFSKKLRCLAQTKVFTLKMQLHAENDCRNSALVNGTFILVIT